MKPYEEVRFPSGIIRWIREGDEYVCRLSEDQMNEIKEFHEDPPKQLELPLVRVEEFVELIKGNEGVFGRPVMRTEWPTEEKPWVKTYSGGKPNYTQPIKREPMVDGWPLYSGLPPVKVQDEREANYKSFAQSAQVLGAQHDPRRSPSGSWTSWDNTMCNPLANARMQTQSAWKDGYDSAKAEWVGLTDKDREWCDEHSHGNTSGAKQKAYGRAIEAKLKEKNGG